MNYFIFQSVIDQYDLRKMQEGRTVTWLASRYRQEMSLGDLVFFWLGGPDDVRGIYGWGRLVSEVVLSDDEYGVKVRYERRLNSYIAIEKIKQVDVLRKMLIVRVPQATNFRLSKEEAEAIAGLIEARDRPQI
jgi:hypothetical protein